MSDETPSREGELLAGKYRLQGRLGVGGMGEVYRARNEFVGRDVAIKVLRPELCRHVEVVQRFLREARAANAVRHEHVVDVIDMGTDDHNVPFIVQELLVGQDLAHHLAARGNRLPVAEILALMIPVVDAIATAHQHGVVHRDLKPENVFLTAGRQGLVPKVLDFGISKIVQPGEEKLTATGTAMGTPTYMAPEQVQGASDLDARADVWALGVMFYELASGVLPFSGPSAGAIFVNICTRDPAPLSQHVADVDPDYARVVERCLRRDLSVRYPSAASLLRDLRHLAAREPIEATGALATTTAAPLVSAAESEIARLSSEARAHAGGTMVGGARAGVATHETVPARPVPRVEETMPPVVRTPPPARRTALFVGTTAALVAAIGIAGVTLGRRRPSPEVAPHPPAARSAPTPIEAPHAFVAAPVAPTTVVAPIADAGSPAAPQPEVVAASPVVVEAPAVPAHGGRRAHGRRRATPPPSTATVALPTIAPPPRPAPRAGVGTAVYE
ncbi:MAG: protein kinase [Deltaproteobacteria bacterium]|nr:protein kinase [Myxococcales bacterium]MDP3213707.1 protein kinase [Deltaproteobacteria bacterium]